MSERFGGDGTDQMARVTIHVPMGRLVVQSTATEVGYLGCNLHYENVGCLVSKPIHCVVVIPKKAVEVDFVAQPIWRMCS